MPFESVPAGALSAQTAALPHADDPWQQLLTVMDRLVADGGCQWCGEQTHESLVKYLLEESHELAEAIETQDLAGVREELGDVLLQVVFHSRLAVRNTAHPFSADDVVRDLVEKMVRRHPHVFANQEVAGDLYTQWDQIKRAEKQRESVLDGIPGTLGALARAQKILGRAQRANLLPVNDTVVDVPEAGDAPSSKDVGEQLLNVVRQAQAAGIDAEGALRESTRVLGEQVRLAERKPSDLRAE